MSDVLASSAQPGPGPGGRARPANPVVEWLLAEAWAVTDSAKLIEQLATQLNGGGLRITRILLFVLPRHPQVAGFSITWRRATGHAEVQPAPPPVLKTAGRPESSVAAVLQGGERSVRWRLIAPAPPLDLPILEELASDGATECMVAPIRFSDGPVNVIAFATDCPGGLADAQLEQLDETASVLARLLETQFAHHTAATLLRTYLGGHTGEQVLKGCIGRGAGEDIHAVIWFCDLRDSTIMADSMPRASFLKTLNDFFDCVAGAVLDHGGEVLRFIGDAAIAIFPIGAAGNCDARRCCDTGTACHVALAAAKEAQARMSRFNQRRARRGEPPLGYGLALHMGDVTYGNIGVAERLEFTVIGAAANEAARLEGLCRVLNRSVLISGEFERCFPGELKSLGYHALRGVRAPQEVFTLPEATDPWLPQLPSTTPNSSRR